jgi:site-specific DNA-methyltransferase (adenine-specific)
MFKVYCEDAIEFLKRFDNESIDLIVTDPAYESLEKHRARGTTTRLKQSDGSSNQWFQIFPNNRFQEFFEQCWRVLKRDAHLYVMSDQETMFFIKPIGEQVGFTFWKPLIWDKQRIGMGYHYRARYEVISFFEKGKRKLNNLGIPDVLQVPKVSTKGAYPTEKPAKLSEILILQSSDARQVVVDPFCGSGSTGEAALGQGRMFIGNDLAPDAVQRTRARLEPLGGLEVDSLDDLLYV